MLAASTSDRRSYLERTLESQLKFAENSRADLIEFIKLLDLSPSATELVERVAQSLEGATLILSEGIDLQVPGAKTRRDARTSLEQDSKAVRIEVDLGLLLEVAGDASYERLQYLFAFVLAHELVHVHQYGELLSTGGTR